MIMDTRMSTGTLTMIIITIMVTRMAIIPICLPNKLPGAACWRLGFRAGWSPVRLRWS